MTDNLFTFGKTWTDGMSLPERDEQFLVAFVNKDGSRRVENFLNARKSRFLSSIERMGGEKYDLIRWGTFLYWNPPGILPSRNQHPNYTATGSAYTSMSEGTNPNRRNDYYLPYPPADGVPIPAITEPVNQIPYLEHFIYHTCKFADHVVSNHTPDVLQMTDPAHLELHTDTVHSEDAQEREKIALRYARSLVGHAYETFMWWGRLDGDEKINPHSNWKHQLAKMKKLHEDVCETCGNNPHWVRDFMRTMYVSEWRRELDEINLNGTQKYMRLPRIDKTRSDLWRPSHENVIAFGGNDAALQNKAWWKAAITSFGDALKRYDRDPIVRREPIHTAFY